MSKKAGKFIINEGDGTSKQVCVWFQPSPHIRGSTFVKQQNSYNMHETYISNFINRNNLRVYWYQFNICYNLYYGY